MSILVTGGAGYIGAHVVRLLQDQGREVVVIDDLSTGDLGRIRQAPFEQIDLTSNVAVDRATTVLRRHRVQAVIHFAAKKSAAESVDRPVDYYRQNLLGLANMLDAAAGTGIGRFVFSSSAAVYGDHGSRVVDESVQPHPMNPYGETKLVGEWLARSVARSCDMRVASLRYFNVAGAGWDDLGDTAVANLLTIVLDRIRRGLAPQVYGADYPTHDGSGVRDYVHVLDVARAHLAVVDYLESEHRPYDVFNVGRGTGTSVFEMIHAVGRALSRTLDLDIIPRRAGDPASVIADVERISTELGWRAEFDLDDIVASAVAAAPNGTT